MAADIAVDEGLVRRFLRRQFPTPTGRG